jgi:endonuclease/exonuclease/phosphatase (EEP) superfamily protein YafD
MNRMKTFLLTTRLALLGIAASAASLFIAWSGLTLPWYVEVVGHFQYGYAAAAAGALVVAAAMRARKDVRLLLALGLPVFVLQFASFEGLPRATASASGTLTVVSFNAHFANEDAARLAGYLAAENPDLVGVVELGAPMAKGLKAKLASLPHRVLLPGTVEGLGLFSRYPLELLHQRSGADAPDAWPAIIVRVHAPRGPVTVALMHPPPPLRELAAEHAAQIADFGRRLAAIQGPVIAMGDLNATPWSAPYRRFRRETGLEAAYPSALGPASWPSELPVALLPLDHVLARGFDLVSGTRGPDLGSDHYPVLARLEPR